MNQVLKIDERAFNEGVKEVLHMRPLVRVVKAAIKNTKSETEHSVKRKVVARKKSK